MKLVIVIVALAVLLVTTEAMPAMEDKPCDHGMYFIASSFS